MRRHAPAVARNRDALLALLRHHLPSAPRVLEVACGTGEHALWFSAAFPRSDWLPVDLDPAAVASASAWREAALDPAEEAVGGPGLRPPRLLDCRTRPWALPADFQPDTVLCCNMIHISPWTTTEGLFHGAAALPSVERIITYGPYRFGGRFLAASNERFEFWLQRRDPRFGVRDAGRLAALAASLGFQLDEIAALPANNHGLVFTRS